MIKNYLTVAFRNLRRHRTYSVINLFGLTVAVGGALLIATYLLQEVNYDRFHEHHRRIYRVVVGTIGTEDAWRGTPAPLGPVLQQTYPEVAAFARVDKTEFLVRTEDRSFYERRMLAVDPSFFEIFSFPVRLGDKEALLSRPDAIVVTESTARRYFGLSDPLGKTVMLGDDRPYVVTGVVADVPPPSHLQFDALIQFEAANENYLQRWGSYNFSTYVQAAPNVSEPLLLSKMRELTVLDRDDDRRTFERLGLQPLTDIHFSYIRGNYEPVFDRKFIFILGTVAVIILLLASINCINITTALAPMRAKEVGVRKVVGSSRARLIGQFIAESFVQVFIAVLTAMLLTGVVAPLISQVLEKPLSVDYRTWCTCCRRSSRCWSCSPT